MGHTHQHDHHGHGHSQQTNKKVLMISFFMIFGFMIVEVVGGLLTNSLALLSDAGHMLSDAAALGLSLLALTFGAKKANQQKTFGYRRFEILAAFINGITLLAIAVYIFWEAYGRFFQPPGVASTGMLIVASIGLLVNVFVAWLLMRGDTKENLNLRSAFLHVLGDLLGSVGAITAALLIMAFGWNIADPIASVVVAVLVLISGWRVTRDSFHILMEGKPAHIDMELAKKELLTIPGVKNVHDLHVWAITSDFPSFTCHLVVTSGTDQHDVLQKASDLVRKQFGIAHSTIQIEGDHMDLHEEDDHCN